MELKHPEGSLMAKEWRISVGLTKDEYEQIHQIARRNNTSVSLIGHLAVLDLLLADAKGEFSLVPEFRPGAEIHHA